MPASSSPLMTADELLYSDIPGKSTELVRGHLVVREPPSGMHGHFEARLLYLIAHHVYARDLGMVFGQDTGFHIASDPDTVRAPDVAFVRQERVPLVPATGYPRLAPDFVAEIVSPNDRPGELLSKVGEWLAAGVSLVWVIDPPHFQARVHRTDGSLSVVPVKGTLDGEDVLPGFQCPLSEVFR